MRRRGRACAGLVISLAAVAVLCAAGPAAAATYHTTPAPDLPADCSQADPCPLLTAVNGAFLKDGDEIVVGPGTYDQTGGGNLFIDDAVDLHGAAGQPRPLILTGASGPSIGISVVDSATVRDLELHHSGGGSGISLEPFSGTASADRLVVKAQGTACSLDDGAISNSVCQGAHNSVGADGLAMIAVSGGSFSATATNVTAIGASTLGTGEHGISVYSEDGASQLLQGKNVIASGGDADVHVETIGATDTAVVALIYSNFSSATVAGGPGAEVAPTAGANQNQSAAPLLADPFPLADPFASDLHQLASSPTVDAGIEGPEAGSADLDGQPRCMGAAPDIGADELSAAPCPSGNGQIGSPGPPISAPPRPRCKGRKATIVAVAGRRTKGTSRRDVIVGTPGRDVIRALGGADLVCGRAGNDLIIGGAGRDTLRGEGGRDTLRGQGGFDLLAGGPGRDSVKQGPGRRPRSSRS